MIPRFVENVQQGKSTSLVTWKFHRRYKSKKMCLHFTKRYLLECSLQHYFKLAKKYKCKTEWMIYQHNTILQRK